MCGSITNSSITDCIEQKNRHSNKICILYNKTLIRNNSGIQIFHLEDWVVKWIGAWVCFLSILAFASANLASVLKTWKNFSFKVWSVSASEFEAF
jgi:hypothetical protein